MLNAQSVITQFFKQTSSPTLMSVEFISIQLEKLRKGIDNVHIDAFLSEPFQKGTLFLIEQIIEERTTTKRRMSDQLSVDNLQRLNQFRERYAAMLATTTHKAKHQNNLVLVQLLELSVIKFIAENVKKTAEDLVKTLKNALLNGDKDNKGQKLYERSVWVMQNYNRFIFRVNSDLFNALYRVELGDAGRALRHSLFGIHWSISENIFSNPILQNAESNDHDMMMENYVLLSQESHSAYNYATLVEFIDVTLNEIVQYWDYQLPPAIEINHYEQLTWQDNVENIQFLLNSELIKTTIEEFPEFKATLQPHLRAQQKAVAYLERAFNNARIMPYILSAYETQSVYENYAKLLKPYLFFQTLSGDIHLEDTWHRLQMAEKTRPLRRADDLPLTNKVLFETYKRITKQAKTASFEKIYRFIADFVKYRHDLKQYLAVQKAIQKIRILTKEEDIKLARANGILHEFDESLEKSNEISLSDIRCHTILKADVRGSTKITSELRKQGLNPATHFSRTFFNPIRQHMEKFGAEKVFIEGDAVILSLFEYPQHPQNWFSVARMCGLGRLMLNVVEEQNRFSIEHRLPILELGLGICYTENAPDFLYDGDQRIMISPAIGDADRLSSCSWKLRKYFANQNLFTRVMVFQQAATDAFKGEKGMTTFRYNLNGIELDTAGFHKLQSEIALRKLKIKLPNSSEASLFFIGSYADLQGNLHDVVIRQGVVHIWQEPPNLLIPTDTYYYEVVTHKTLLNAILRETRQN